MAPLEGDEAIADSAEVVDFTQQLSEPPVELSSLGSNPNVTEAFLRLAKLLGVSCNVSFCWPHNDFMRLDN